jgi:hypothetical protein
MVDPDPYGDLGAISDASWTERWMCWDKKAQDAYMADVASWPLLCLEQMEHLLQGLLSLEPRRYSMSTYGCVNYS